MITVPIRFALHMLKSSAMDQYESQNEYRTTKQKEMKKQIRKILII